MEFISDITACSICLPDINTRTNNNRDNNSYTVSKSCQFANFRFHKKKSFISFKTRMLTLLFYFLSILVKILLDKVVCKGYD